MLCKICASAVTPKTVPYRNEGRHKDSIFDELTIAICSECGSSWTSNPPSPDQLMNYYAEQYEPRQIKKLDTGSWPIWDPRPASLITLARLITQFQTKDFFIDVGPGNGAALSMAPYLLPSPKLGCIEFNKRFIQFLRKNLPDIVIKGSVSDFTAEYGTDFAKMIYSAHCLEHFPVDDLEQELATLRSALTPDGALAIEVPYGGMGRMMSSNHSPHLVFFTPEGLQAMLRRAGFGIKLCFTAVGRTRQGQRHVSRFYPVPTHEEVNEEFSCRVATLNATDFIGIVPSETGSAVIKCLAVRS